MDAIHTPTPLSQYHAVSTAPEFLAYPGKAQSAVNALVLANQSSWKEEFLALLDQAHRINLMPNELRCIFPMFEARGFIRQPAPKAYHTVADVLAYMNDHCTHGQTAIVKTSCHNFIAILPAGHSRFVPPRDDNSPYHAYGLPTATDRDYSSTIISSNALRQQICDIWMHWADGQDHSPTKRRKSSRFVFPHPTPYTRDNERFHFLQKNPTQATGDCAIRAMASVLGISWDEALDRIAEASGYASTTVNSPDIFSRLLLKEGFVKRTARKCTGRDFCRELDKVLRNGERVFVYLGRSHVAAAVPVSENGGTRYKIEDCWDSSNRTVVEYWIRETAADRIPGPVTRKPAVKKSVQQEPDLLVPGTRISHPVFGTGTIHSVDASGWVAIDFPGGKFRVLDRQWIRSNCVIPAR